MIRPEMRRKFKLRPIISCLLQGVSGTGKSLAIAAIHRRMYELMADITSTELDKLPKRVFRVRASQLFSMWLGESDKNVDRIFDEVESLAEVPFVNDRGRSFRLPVLVVLEEADGMGRNRGDEANAVYDRIMTTTLQRLDPNRSSLANKFVVFLSSTNEPHMVDPAFLRRIGGTVETFGRLNQKAFVDILHKHTRDLPAEGGDGSPKRWKAIIADVEHWLYDEHEPVVELQCQGQNPLVKHRRDFLTGAMIDRAVQEASTEAWEMAIGGEPESGLSTVQLAEALDRQVQNVVSQLQPRNVHSYLDLPEGLKVSGIKRLARG